MSGRGVMKSMVESAEAETRMENISMEYIKGDFMEERAECG